MAFKVMYYSSLQSNSSLLNLVLSSMRWSLTYPTRPKTRLKDQRGTLYTEAQEFMKKIVSEYRSGSWSKTRFLLSRNVLSYYFVRLINA